MRLKVDSAAAYDRFINRVIESKVVWFLRDIEHDYPMYCPSHCGEINVVPFWSDKAYAKRSKKIVEFKTEVDLIPLTKFLEITIPHLVEYNLLIGPNWDANLAGAEIDPRDLCSRLEKV